MGEMATQITSASIVYSAVFYSGVDQIKHKAPRHWPLWGELTRPVTRNMFLFDDVIMILKSTIIAFLHWSCDILQ